MLEVEELALVIVDSTQVLAEDRCIGIWRQLVDVLEYVWILYEGTLSICYGRARQAHRGKNEEQENVLLCNVPHDCCSGYVRTLSALYCDDHKLER